MDRQVRALVHPTPHAGVYSWFRVWTDRCAHLCILYHTMVRNRHAEKYLLGTVRRSIGGLGFKV